MVCPNAPVLRNPCPPTPGHGRRRHRPADHAARDGDSSVARRPRSRRQRQGTPSPGLPRSDGQAASGRSVTHRSCRCTTGLGAGADSQRLVLRRPACRRCGGGPQGHGQPDRGRAARDTAPGGGRGRSDRQLRGFGVSERSANRGDDRASWHGPGHQRVGPARRRHRWYVWPAESRSTAPPRASASVGLPTGCGPVRIVDSYARVVSPTTCDDWHGDALQGYDGTRLTIRDSSLILAERRGCYGTAPFFYPRGQGNTYATVENVRVRGGGYPFRLGTRGTVRGLRVVRDSWGYGPIDVACGRLSAWRASIIDPTRRPAFVRRLACNTNAGW